MYRILRLLIFTGILLSGISVLGQEEEGATLIEDGYIETMKHLMALEASLNNDIETLEQDVDGIDYLLYPNVSTKLGFRVNYRFISAGFSIAPGFLPGNGDENEKGETKTINLGTALTFRHWFGDIRYTKYKGYYLENTSDFLPNWEDGDPYIQDSDLKYSGIKLGFGYSLNPRFSFVSRTNQTQRQLKSAGSFIPELVFRYYNIDRPGDNNSFGQNSHNYETSIGPGYVYTLVFNKSYYISLGAKFGLGYQHTKLTTELPVGNGVSTQDNFLVRWEGDAGLGYNGKRWYTGLYGTLAGSQYNQEVSSSARNSRTRLTYHIFFGYRIEAPKFIKKQVDFIVKKSPFKVE